MKVKSDKSSSKLGSCPYKRPQNKLDEEGIIRVTFQAQSDRKYPFEQKELTVFFDSVQKAGKNLKKIYFKLDDKSNANFATNYHIKQNFNLFNKEMNEFLVTLRYCMDGDDEIELIFEKFQWVTSQFCDWIKKKQTNKMYNIRIVEAWKSKK